MSPLLEVAGVEACIEMLEEVELGANNIFLVMEEGGAGIFYNEEFEEDNPTSKVADPVTLDHSCNHVLCPEQVGGPVGRDGGAADPSDQCWGSARRRWTKV